MYTCTVHHKITLDLDYVLVLCPAPFTHNVLYTTIVPCEYKHALQDPTRSGMNAIGSLYCDFHLHMRVHLCCYGNVCAFLTAC